MKVDRITIRMEPELQHEIQQLAEATGKSESDIVREAVATYVEIKRGDETFFDRARKTKFFGCVKNAPSDLSTNKDHFDGFGGG